MSADPCLSMVRAVLGAGLVLSTLAPSVALATLRPHHHARGTRLEGPAGDAGVGVGPQRDTSGTRNRGYVYNGIGYGRFVPGPDGSFGGYPAGSDGAKELMIQQSRKCQDVPEEC